jgi:GNAT superfamily N-acetyltransferase
LVVRIELLANDPKTIGQLARWHSREWGHLYAHWGYEEAFAEFVEMAGRSDEGPLPLTWIARTAPTSTTATTPELLGSVTLFVTDDLAHFDHLTPWLGSLFVAPAARGRGLATQLVRTVERWADDHGLAAIYLFTPGQESMYLKLGWNVLDTVTAHGHPATVMVRRAHAGSSTADLTT